MQVRESLLKLGYGRDVSREMMQKFAEMEKRELAYVSTYEDFENTAFMSRLNPVNYWCTIGGMWFQY